MKLWEEVKDRNIEKPPLLYSVKDSFSFYKRASFLCSFMRTCFGIFLRLRRVTEPHRVCCSC